MLTIKARSRSVQYVRPMNNVKVALPILQGSFPKHTQISTAVRYASLVRVALETCSNSLGPEIEVRSNPSESRE